MSESHGGFLGVGVLRRVEDEVDVRYDNLTYQLCHAHIWDKYKLGAKLYWMLVYVSLDLTMASETTSFFQSQDTSCFYEK